MNGYDNINNNENIVPLFDSGVSSQPVLDQAPMIQPQVSSFEEQQSDIPPSLGAIKNLTEAPTAEAPTGDVLGPMNVMPMDLPQADPLTAYDNGANLQNNIPVQPELIMMPGYNMPQAPQYNMSMPQPEQYNVPVQPSPTMMPEYNMPSYGNSNEQYSTIAAPASQPQENMIQPEFNQPAPMPNEGVVPPTFEQPVAPAEDESEPTYEVVDTPSLDDQKYEVANNTTLPDTPEASEEAETSTEEDTEGEPITSDPEEKPSEEQPSEEISDEEESEDVLDMMEEEDTISEEEIEEQLDEQKEEASEAPKKETPVDESDVSPESTGKMSSSEAYNKIKKLVESLKESNPNIRTEEYDFTDIYKLVVKIEK